MSSDRKDGNQQLSRCQSPDSLSKFGSPFVCQPVHLLSTMYYPIGWPKKLKFQFKDISAVAGPASLRPEDGHSSDKLRHSNGNGKQDACGSSQVNGSANISNGHVSDSEAGHQKIPLDEKRLLQIAANSDRTLFAVLTPRSLHVWFSRVRNFFLSSCRFHV